MTSRPSGTRSTLPRRASLGLLAFLVGCSTILPKFSAALQGVEPTFFADLWNLGEGLVSDVWGWVSWLMWVI
jgi:hypothetical protein